MVSRIQSMIEWPGFRATLFRPEPVAFAVRAGAPAPAAAAVEFALAELAVSGVGDLAGDFAADLNGDLAGELPVKLAELLGADSVCLAVEPLSGLSADLNGLPAPAKLLWFTEMV